MAKEKKFIFLNSQIYESVEVQEGNSTFYEGIYKREWYEESFTEFWIPFLKNLKVKVYLPANDLFHTYKNNEGLLMVESEWGFCYEINEILEGDENPCFYALDRDKKGHRVYLKIVEEQ